MRRSKMAYFMRPLLTGAALAAVSALGGCFGYDYLERRDTMTLGVGDAVATNKATQTINRWPAAAREDRWLSDGERGRTAVSRYRARKVPDPKSLDNGSTQVEPEMLEKTPTATNGN